MTYKYHLIFSLTWIFSLLYYPIYIEPTSTHIRFVIYIIVTVWTLINIVFSYRFLLNNTAEKPFSIFFNISLDKYLIALICLILLNIILHIYPISFPLTLPFDEVVH